jgi:hypothetical protein
MRFIRILCLEVLFLGGILEVNSFSCCNDYLSGFMTLKDLYSSGAGAERPSSKQHSIIAWPCAHLVHIKGEELPLNKAFYYPTVLPAFGQTGKIITAASGLVQDIFWYLKFHFMSPIGKEYV